MRLDRPAVRAFVLRGLLATALLAAPVLVGCNGKDKPGQPLEILPRDDLVARYNARAAVIQRLWSKCHIEARVPKLDDNDKPILGKYETYSLDGNLLLRKPRDLWLQGHVAFSEPMFGLHSNAERYWYWVKPGTPVAYVGRYDGPAADQFPLRPDYLLQTLGIFAIPDELWAFRRGDTYDVIQIMGVDLSGAETADPKTKVRVMLHLVKEIYLERVHHDPAEVRLYDLAGDPLVISHLGRYEEVDGVRMPTHLVYRFVPVDATFTLDLKKMTLTKENWDKKDWDAVFTYRPPPIDVAPIDLDERARMGPR